MLSAAVFRAPNQSEEPHSEDARTQVVAGKSAAVPLGPTSGVQEFSTSIVASQSARNVLSRHKQLGKLVRFN